MTNREKYAKEILDIVCAGKNVAVKNGVPYICGGWNKRDGIACDECDLNPDANCNTKFVKWCKADCDKPSG